MFQEVGSALQIDIQDLFQISLYDTPVYPNLEKQFAKKNVRYFESGRNAVEYIFRFCISSDKKVVLLPEFLCSSISDAILRAGWKFQYYTVSKDLEIVEEEIEEKIQEYPVLFFIDYFGKNQSQKFLKRLKESYSELVLIEDCTQSIMTKRTEESIVDYMLASLRKWFPIPSGGCVWSNHSLPSVPMTCGISEYTFYYFLSQIMKTEYLKNNMLDKKKYLEWMNEGVTKLFEDYSIREMDQVSRHLLAIIDWNEASQKRRENYEILHNLIHKNGKFEIVSELEEGEVPFCMPVCTQNRDDLLRYLIRNKIYCNVHWRLSEEQKSVSPEIKNLSNQILSIPCDQRYGKEEMKYIGHVLNEWGMGRE